jgi:prepilin peptidase CpaA
MTPTLSALPVALAYVAMIAVLAQVIYSDFFHYRIGNRSVLAILAAWAIVAASYRFAHVQFDLLIAAILFAFAFGFWVFRMIGAGDVKLLGACGLVVGFADAATFAVLILGFSIVFIAILRILTKVLLLPVAVGARVIEIAETKKIPYGVPIALAAICIIGSRLAEMARP